MNAFQFLGLVFGWIVAVGLGLLWLVILYLIATKHIDLQYIVSEPNHDASLSRFQFLVFTFVIAMSLYLITVSNTPITFPTIPPDVLALLGISGGSYLISKSIQTNRDVNMEREKAKSSSKPAAQSVVIPGTPTNGNGHTADQGTEKINQVIG